MELVFINLLNMSITASYVIIPVILLRFILRKVPKKLFYILWGVIAFRLISPFSFESFLSLIPSTTTLSPEIIYHDIPQINSDIDAFVPDTAASVSPTQVVMFIGSIIWIVGMTSLLLYGVFTMLRLKKKVAFAIPCTDTTCYRA